VGFGETCGTCSDDWNEMDTRDLMTACRYTPQIGMNKKANSLVGKRTNPLEHRSSQLLGRSNSCRATKPLRFDQLHSSNSVCLYRIKIGIRVETEGTDIIDTATRADQPIVKDTWVKDGSLFIYLTFTIL